MLDLNVLGNNLLESVCTNYTPKQISKEEYNNFLKEFVFLKLKGKGFGYSFCEKFGFNGSILKSLGDETAKFLIEKLGYIGK